MPRGGGGFSGPLSSIAVAGIALGVVVMVMAVSILRGFQADISGKVVGFGSHLTISAYGGSAIGEESPIPFDEDLAARVRSLPGIRHLQTYATKGGMVKTADQIYGIVFRGLSHDYDTTFFASCLTEGRLPQLYENGKTDTRPSASNEVLISSTIAARLGLHTGDKMRTYFWQDQTYRSRAFDVCGIYNTDLSEMDELYVIGDLRQVQRLNGWDTENYIGGYEVLVDDFDKLDATAKQVSDIVPYDLQVKTIRQATPALFSWLDLLEANITLILTIMCIVSAVAIVSALLIMIFEKRSTIGTLKALGATDCSVRSIFLIKSARMTVEGIAIGSAVALALSLIQIRWQVVRLDPESYSMSHVPVELNVWVYAAIGIGTLAVCLLALLLPAGYISRISPAKTMRSER